MGTSKSGLGEPRTGSRQRQSRRRSQKPRLKVLFIGLGGIGQRHLRNLRALQGDGAEVLAYRVRRLSHVVTPTLQSDASRDVEREYGITVFDDLAAALAERPQVAFICNPSSLHIPVALACIRAGCDLFLEKPVSNDLGARTNSSAKPTSARQSSWSVTSCAFTPVFSPSRSL